MFSIRSILLEERIFALRTIKFFAVFWFELIRLFPSLRRAQKFEQQGEKQQRDAIVQQKVRYWTDRLLTVAGVVVKVEGLENIPKGPVVFISNHQGNFDIPILLSHLDKAYPLLAKKEMMKIPLVRSWMKVMGCVFLDRQNPRQAVRSLEAASALLSEGYSIIVFPEGTRSQSDQLGEFKSGAFKVAVKSRLPLIPILIDGSYRAMEANHGRIFPAAVSLKILPPIDTAQLTKEEQKELPEKVLNMLSEAKKQLI